MSCATSWPGVAVEQARDVARHAVPRAAVVALAIGEEAHRDDAPDAVGAMNGDRADRIVHLQHALDELARDAHEHAGHEADDRRRDGLTNPLGAVMATRPARNALPLIDASGFP